MKKPMLAETVDHEDQLSDIKLPVYVSPKLDGVRCLVDEQRLPYSRNGKRFANKHLHPMFETANLPTLDGELGLGNPTDKDFFTRTSAWLRRKDDPYPEFPVTYWVFDYVSEEPFDLRWSGVEKYVMPQFYGKNFELKLVPQYLCERTDQILEWERIFVEEGYEGIIIRGSIYRAPYKHGRGTWRSQELFKMKRFADTEGVIVGFEQANENQNEAELDAFGHTTRSSSKEGLVPLNRVGRILVQSKQFKEIVKLGTGIGLTKDLREHMWKNPDEYIGRTVTFAYQPGSDYEKARFPSFKGFREYE